MSYLDLREAADRHRTIDLILRIDEQNPVGFIGRLGEEVVLEVPLRVG